MFILWRCQIKKKKTRGVVCKAEGRKCGTEKRELEKVKEDGKCFEGGEEERSENKVGGESKVGLKKRFCGQC